MKKLNFFTKIFLMLIASCSLNYSQSYLTHNTGTIKVSVFDNGNIGNSGGDGAGGDGIIFRSGVNALYSGGFILAASSRSEANGQIGSFNINNDLVNTSALSGFTSNSDFDEITVTEFNDSGAPNPYGVTIRQTSSSSSPDTILYIKYEVFGSDSTINDLYLGMFADWDVGGSDYASNMGGYDPSRNLAYEYGISGKSDTNYYGIVALDGMSGAKVTTDNSSSTVRNLSYNRISSFQNQSISSQGDYRMWIGSGPFNLSVGGKVEANFAIIAAGNLEGLKNCADLAISKYNSSLPVELTTFSAVSRNNIVKLKWLTATEVNNYGFEIQRNTYLLFPSREGKEQNDKGMWEKVGFVKGHGNSNSPKEYSFSDEVNGSSGSYLYRLKQLDVDGQYEYSKEIEVKVGVPAAFELEQNYPNPFNPSTEISFRLAKLSHVNLLVYDMLGEKVAELVNRTLPAGTYHKNFNASGLSSGTYLYVLQTNGKQFVKRMQLLK